MPEIPVPIVSLGTLSLGTYIPRLVPSQWCKGETIVPCNVTHTLIEVDDQISANAESQYEHGDVGNDGATYRVQNAGFDDPDGEMVEEYDNV